MTDPGEAQAQSCGQLPWHSQSDGGSNVKSAIALAVRTPHVKYLPAAIRSCRRFAMALTVERCIPSTTQSLARSGLRFSYHGSTNSRSTVGRTNAVQFIALDLHTVQALPENIGGSAVDAFMSPYINTDNKPRPCRIAKLALSLPFSSHCCGEGLQLRIHKNYRMYDS